MAAKKSKSFLKQKKTFSGSQILLFTIVFAAVGAVAIWQSLAAPHNGGGGGKGGSGTISLVVETDQNSDGLPNYGDVIKFNVSTTDTTEPHVSLSCSQNGTVVYNSVTGYYASYPWPWTQNMTLSSGAWTSGAADCTATGYYFGARAKTVNFATLSFHVNP
jgi:hypothetical protein